MKPITQSSIVTDTLKNGPSPIKPSEAKGEWQGPTTEYKFSNDSNGPHKVEYYRWMAPADPTYNPGSIYGDIYQKRYGHQY